MEELHQQNKLISHMLIIVCDVVGKSDITLSGAMNNYQFNIFADYFQIYLEDENAHIDLTSSWSPEAIENLIAFDSDSRQGVGIGTVRNMDVPVTVEILDAPPRNDDFSEWDQVNECGIEVLSGKVVLAGCTDYYPDAPRISVQPGTYRVRVYYGNLDTLSADGLDGEDHYCIRCWPAPFQSPTILKKRDT